jgi:hypothetical protein
MVPAAKVTGSGLGRLFSRKLVAEVPVDSPLPLAAHLAGSEPQGHGLGRMFDRMAAPPTPAAPASAKVAAGRKKAVKW